MKILCTFPGKFGDLLWALPTVRAISRRAGVPVDLAIPAAFRTIAPLLSVQDYLLNVFALDDWVTQDTAPISPREPPHTAPPDRRVASGFTMGGPYHRVLHLGYREWPLPDVLRHTIATANDALHAQAPALWYKGGDVLTVEELDLATPWIVAPSQPVSREPAAIVVAFTDEYFELKFGVSILVLEQFARHAPNTLYRVLTTPGSRWITEAWASWTSLEATDWTGYARVLDGADVCLTDCSAAHVLAVAMGVPAVLLEPQEMRWNPVFYPLGHTGPQVTLVCGVDGRPTFDARHTLDTLLRVRSERHEQEHAT